MNGVARRGRVNRVLPRTPGDVPAGRRHIPIDAPHKVAKTVIDFRTLTVPQDVRLALADAFWNHVGARTPKAICYAWRCLRVFGRFVGETAAGPNWLELFDNRRRRHTAKCRRSTTGIEWN